MIIPIFSYAQPNIAVVSDDYIFGFSIQKHKNVSPEPIQDQMATWFKPNTASELLSPDYVSYNTLNVLHNKKQIENLVVDNHQSAPNIDWMTLFHFGPPVLAILTGNSSILQTTSIISSGIEIYSNWPTLIQNQDVTNLALNIANIGIQSAALNDHTTEWQQTANISNFGIQFFNFYSNPKKPTTEIPLSWNTLFPVVPPSCGDYYWKYKHYVNSGHNKFRSRNSFKHRQKTRRQHKLDSYHKLI